MSSICAAGMRRQGRGVVLAKAGTHTPRRVLLKGRLVPTSPNHDHSWLWVPAFAGATMRIVRDSSCHITRCQLWWGRSPKISRHESSELCFSFRRLKAEGTGKPGAAMGHSHPGKRQAEVGDQRAGAENDDDERLFRTCLQSFSAHGDDAPSFKIIRSNSRRLISVPVPGRELSSMSAARARRGRFSLQARNAQRRPH